MKKELPTWRNTVAEICSGMFFVMPSRRDRSCHSGRADRPQYKPETLGQCQCKTSSCNSSKTNAISQQSNQRSSVLPAQCLLSNDLEMFICNVWGVDHLSRFQSELHPKITASWQNHAIEICDHPTASEQKSNIFSQLVWVLALQHSASRIKLPLQWLLCQVLELNQFKQNPKYHQWILCRDVARKTFGGPPKKWYTHLFIHSCRQKNSTSHKLKAWWN